MYALQSRWHNFSPHTRTYVYILTFLFGTGSLWIAITPHTMTGAIQIDAVVESRTDLGESPVWCERTQRLYFIDINSKKIHIWDCKSKTHDSISTPELVGTVILAPNEEQLVVALTR